MAGRNFDLSIIINALDKTGNTFSSLNKNLKLTDGQLLAIGATSTAIFAGMVYSLNKATDAAAEQQTAEINLAQAMLKTGQYTDENFKSNLNLASSLQEVTRYGDETIISAQALLATFIKDADAVKKLTPLVLDLATAKGMDLNSAAMLVAKSVGSSTNALARYGIEIEGAAGSTKRTESAITALSSLFAGKAQADALGYAGQMAILKNRFSEIQESIGTLLLPKLTELGGSVISRTKEFQGWIETHKQLASAIGGISLSFVGVIALISSMALLIPKLIEGFIVLGAVIKTHPILAIASILIPLILNWDKLRNSIDENSIAWRIVGKTMDIFKASAMAIIETLKALSQGFGALGLVIVGNFSEAKKWFNDMNKTIATIPATVIDAYNNIDSTTKSSNKNRQKEESTTAEIIKKLSEDSKNAFLNNNNEMTASEKKSLDEKEKQNLNYYQNLVAMAEAKKETDSQGYTDALLAEQTYLSERLVYLQQHQNDSLAANQLYYDTLAEQRKINEQLEAQSQFNMKSGFLLALTEMQNAQTNWYNIAKTIFNGFKNALTAGFTTMIENIGNGWENFAKGFAQIADMMKSVLIQVAAQMAAEWILKTGLMTAATLVWKGIEIVAAAAVAAAKAAAASAWALWGAIAIGAAVGYGVLKMANAFQTGTRGFEGGMALVGENGPELVNLPSGSDVLNNAETRNILNSSRGNSGGGKSLNVNINLSGSTFMGTVDEISDALSDRIYKNLKLNAVV